MYMETNEGRNVFVTQGTSQHRGSTHDLQWQEIMHNFIDI